jgi:hypothetical protein
MGKKPLLDKGWREYQCGAMWQQVLCSTLILHQGFGHQSSPK